MKAAMVSTSTSETVTPPQQAQKPERQKRVHCWPSLVLCVIFFAIAGVAMFIDFRNNYNFGSSINHELGMVMGLAAIAAGAIPAGAALLGRWDLISGLGTAFCVLLTVAAAVLAYNNSQGSDILHKVGAKAKYEDAQSTLEKARAEIKEAEAEARSIDETLAEKHRLPSAALYKLYEEATERKKAESTKERGGCSKDEKTSKCLAAEREATAYLEAFGKVQKKEEALKRADNLRAGLSGTTQTVDAGPVEQNMTAIMLSAQLGRTPEEVMRAISQLVTLFAIGATLCMALLMHHGTKLGMRAFGIGQLGHQLAAPKLEEVAQPKGMEIHPAPVKGATILQVIQGGKRKQPTHQEKQVALARELFIETEAFESKGQAVQDHYEAAHMKRWPKTPVPSRNRISDILAEAGFEKKRSGGVKYRVRPAG